MRLKRSIYFINSILIFSSELSNFYTKIHRNIDCTAFTGKSIGEISAPEAYSPTWQQQINSRQSWSKQLCEWPDSHGGLRSAASIYYGNTVSGKYIPNTTHLQYGMYCVLGEWGLTSTGSKPCHAITPSWLARASLSALSAEVVQQPGTEHDFIVSTADVDCMSLGRLYHTKSLS